VPRGEIAKIMVAIFVHQCYHSWLHLRIEGPPTGYTRQRSDGPIRLIQAQILCGFIEGRDHDEEATICES